MELFPLQSDPYVRVQVNNVIKGRTEVVNNSQNLLPHNLASRSQTLSFFRFEPGVGSDHIHPWYVCDLGYLSLTA
jgi:hypothetical protein